MTPHPHKEGEGQGVGASGSAVVPGISPGPWSFRRASQASANIFDIEGDGRLLAFTAATCDESEANARLFAAARDLLKAAERMVAATEADQHFIGGEHDALKAAIARAKGLDQ